MNRPEDDEAGREEIPHDELVDVQQSTEINGLSVYLAGQGDGLAESLLRLSGLDWPVPDFSTVSRRQQHLRVVITHRGRNDAQHLLIDSTGVEMLGKGEWKQRGTVPTTVVSSERYIGELMHKPGRYVPSRSPAAA